MYLFFNVILFVTYIFANSNLSTVEVVAVEFSNCFFHIGGWFEADLAFIFAASIVRVGVGDSPRFTEQVLQLGPTRSIQ